MKRVQIESICRDRLEGWTRKLVEEGATPMLLVGVNHNSRRLAICTLETMDDDQICTFLEGAILYLTSSRGGQ